MDDLTRQLEKRDRHRRYTQSLRTPAERMAACWRIQAMARDILLSSPEGFAAFLKRNHRQRAIRHDDAWNR